jgi:hypothetical protein
MRLHSNSSALGWLVATSLAASLLGSCSDDPAPNGGTGNGGSSNGGGGATAATGAGGKTAGNSSVGAAGNESAGTSPGGKSGGGGTPNGGSASGSGGTGGSSGGTGGSSGGGNGGSGGAERVYTIEGCEERGAGGAGSIAEANIGGEGNVGGESNVGGEGSNGGVGNAGGEGNAGAPVGGAGEGGAGPIIPVISASFTVYDFVTDRPVQTCVDRVDDFDITITGDAPLTVAVNLPPGLMPGSVRWTYDGVALMPHSTFPYSLGPDDNGDYQEPMPPLTVGEHVLSITVYDEAGGMGAVLGQASITIRVIEG